MANIYKVTGPEGVVSYRTGSRENVVGSVAVMEALPAFSTDQQRKRYVRGLAEEVKETALQLHRNGNAEYGDYLIERINVDSVTFNADEWTATTETEAGIVAESGDVQVQEIDTNDEAEPTHEEPAEEPASVAVGHRW